jgi:hypothetical protein
MTKEPATSHRQALSYLRNKRDLLIPFRWPLYQCITYLLSTLESVPHLSRNVCISLPHYDFVKLGSTCHPINPSDILAFKTPANPSVAARTMLTFHPFHVKSEVRT